METPLLKEGSALHSINVNRIRIEQNQNQDRSRNVNNIADKKADFGKVLKKEIQKSQNIKFSKHALERLEQRKIQLTTNEVDKIDNAINKAAEKGIKETLIIMNNKAFIASVPNRTVITAAADNQLKESVFTNIDGAIFA
ncbi:MAG: flagellar protein [Clostridiales bacterium]|nr:flagellar protein [Clostridiales bacterium]